jgi:beta-glucosidase
VSDPSPAGGHGGFPDDFWWGTASSALQCEGAAPRSDWFRREQAGEVPRSGDGNDFATRYAEDFALLADHALVHHRLSLDWARLEPESGRHDPAAVEHTLDVLRAGRDAGLSRWVTLHHRSAPGWFSQDDGGFTDRRARRFWHRHVDWVAETFGDLVSGWMPIDQPVLAALAGDPARSRAPGRTPGDVFAETLEALHLANHEAWRLLRGGDPPVATCHNLAPIHAAARGREPSEREVAQERADRLDDAFWGWTRALTDGVLQVPGRGPIELDDMAGSFDLIGFTYFHAWSVYVDSVGPYPVDARPDPTGFAPWTEGLGVVVRRLADELPGRPLLVAAYGLGTEDDSWRVDVLRESWLEIERALDDGIDVRGLFHWTAVDGYEDERGFTLPYGLFDRDRNARPSAKLIQARATGSPEPD